MMKKQFQCYEVQRLGMKKLVEAHCATLNDNYLLERGIPIFLKLFFFFSSRHHPHGFQVHLLIVSRQFHLDVLRPS